MDEMFAEFEFNEASEYTIQEVNGVPIPQDYLEFMSRHNGGEGNVGENSYMQLVKLEELEKFNRDYQISEYLSGIFIFGTDLGGMLFGYDSKKGLYCSIDSCSLGEEDIIYAGRTFEEFAEEMDKGNL